VEVHSGKNRNNNSNILFMKNNIRTLALFGSILAVGATAQAQEWGHDSDSINGTTITDASAPVGGGNLDGFSVTGTPSGSSDFRALLPGGPVALTLGETLSFSGTFAITSGSMGGGLLRFGFLDYGSVGTLTGTSWNVASTATSYGYWPSTGGTAQSNPGGGSDIVKKPSSAGNAWYSGSGGSGVGTIAANAGSISTGSYNFSLSLNDTVSGVAITYSLVGSGYSASGTVTDASSPLTAFNSVGFFGNGSDSAFAGGVTFSDLSVSLTPAPEPASMALLGLGALVGTFAVRRRNK
jgi:hypothetical protein